MELTQKQKQLREEIVQFAERNLRADFMKHTREPAFPHKAYQLICERGYMGFMLPEEYGGSGGGVTEYCILLEELARVDHNVPWAIDVTVAVASVIAKLGTEAQKRKYLPKLLDGSIIPAFALSDLAGGSNLRQMGTQAECDADGTWTITGRKAHIHNCELAELWLVFAASKDGQEAILVEGRDGVILERKYQPFGFRCVPCHQLLFNGVKAPDENLLGTRGKGVLAALTGALNYTRIGNASIVIGIARAAIEVALSFAMGRRLQEGTITDQQAIQHMIADLVTELDAASLLRWRAAAMHDRGENPVREASQAKLYCTEKATHISGTLLRLMGAYGTYEGMPMADYFNSCKTLELGSGASEIHRNNIAREVLREYSRRFDSGELFNWAQTDDQKAMLELNERSAKILHMEKAS
jgi:alkylation response protein AidB-like acyl-CoA dehydrogenase